MPFLFFFNLGLRCFPFASSNVSHSRLGGFFFLSFSVSFLQQSREDIDKPKMQSLEDILKELDAEEVKVDDDVEGDEELELERRMEALLAGEMVSCIHNPFSCRGEFGPTAGAIVIEGLCHTCSNVIVVVVVVFGTVFNSVPWVTCCRSAFRREILSFQFCPVTSRSHLTHCWSYRDFVPINI